MFSLLTPRDNENDPQIMVVAEGWRSPLRQHQCHT